VAEELVEGAAADQAGAEAVEAAGRGGDGPA
jgi:hypothetical protein